jgi:hypothetical protein
VIDQNRDDDNTASGKPKADRVSDRPTEDELARGHLGGTRGHPSLGEAPMTGQRRKKTFPKDENDGHVA